MRILRLQKEPFELSAEIASLTAGRDVGALVTFTGLCRHEGRLLGLEIEHYPDMAAAEIARVVEEACGRWPLDGVLVIHRYGLIRPGEPIVLVATTSRHRGEAFAAAEFLMDYLKTRAPFWKREHTRAGLGEWVGAREEDAQAAEKWGS
ncbi:MAG TPA: molybdenum cofactor biosynthesis protein MoaE [Methylovirgula sp.]|nr:molybdenum cofactor biosynthesis protein MoaE [Methylovirgula sp.]